MLLLLFLLVLSTIKNKWKSKNEEYSPSNHCPVIVVRYLTRIVIGTSSLNPPHLSSTVMICPETVCPEV